MSKMKKKGHKTVKLLASVVMLAGAGTGVYFYFGKPAAETQEPLQTYKEETVNYGTVAVGITESGTVALGSQEQEFSVPEVISVSSDSGTDITSSGQSEGQSGSGNSQNQSQMSMGGGSQSTGQSSMGSGMSGGNSSSTSTSAGTATSLEVEEVCIKVGQVVSEGDAVLKITEESIEDYRADLQAAVESAQLQVRQEEINVESKQAEADYTYQMYLAEGKTAEETYQATLTSLDNEVADLEEELAQAQSEAEELQAELDAGYDVEEELEEAQLTSSTLEANLQIAENNRITQSIEAKRTYENALTNYNYAEELYAIDTDGLEDDLEEAKDTLREAEDALSAFDETIGDGIIYAEYSGTVLSAAYSAGDTLTSESTVASYSDADNVTITVPVSQEDIAQISIGSQVSITLTAYPDETFDGEVTGIETSSSVGSSTVNYDVEVRFTGDTEKVYSGMTGEVTFVEKQTEDTLYISNKAVHQDGSRSWVKVLQEDGSIEEVTIKTGFSNGSIVAVEEGLEEGQTVIIESQVTS